MVRIHPSTFHGIVSVPPSKSFAHRAIIGAALASGVSRIDNIAYSDDINASLGAIEALGAKVTRGKDFVEIDGTNTFHVGSVTIDAVESGSTLRFMLSVASLFDEPTTFIGRARLPERPLSDLLAVLETAGVHVTSNEQKLPVTVQGKLQSGDYKISGNVSSQYITGLLLTLPLLQGDSTITLTTPLESISYITITLEVLKLFGISIMKRKNGWKILGGQTYNPIQYTVEGDWSQAAFFLVGGAISGGVALGGLNPESVQGDRSILPILREIGAHLYWQNGMLICIQRKLLPTDIDCSNIPDLVPILAVALSFTKGKSNILNATRARMKESDRLQTTAQGLSRLGVKVVEGADALVVFGKNELTDATVHGYTDHRIVMAMAIAGLRVGKEVIIDDATSIEKSYPNFFEDYNTLGGKATWVQPTEKV